MKKKLTDRLKARVKKTRLYNNVVTASKWAAGNASALMDLLITGARTAGSSLNARNAAVDITHAVEDYACSDYKCLALDMVATACDVTGSVVAFLPGNMTKRVFGAATSGSCFCRTLRNKCKETKVFGCK